MNILYISLINIVLFKFFINFITLLKFTIVYIFLYP
jgi:hypothetical protein